MPNFTTPISFHFLKPRATLALLTLFAFLFSKEVNAQCGDDCNEFSPATANVSAANNSKICITGSGTFSGTITLKNNNILCIAAGVTVAPNAIININGEGNQIINHGEWNTSVPTLQNSLRLVENYGTMNTLDISINKNATFNNYGTLTIKGYLIVQGGSSVFENKPNAVATITNDVVVNDGTLIQGGTMYVDGNFTSQTSSSNVVITGALFIGPLTGPPVTGRGNLNISGGKFEINEALVTVNGDYTQQGSNTRVSGSPTPTSRCGTFEVKGISSILGGKFGFDNTYLGMCDNEGSITGFDKAPNLSDVEPTGRQKCSCYAALPISLLYFTAQQNNNQVALNWATATETDNDYFSLEKSKDGRQFNEVGRVKGAGTSTQKLTYQFVDDFPFAGVSYYRLKQVDFNGAFTYSKIVKVSSDVTTALKIYPNPITQEELWVEVNDGQATDMRITIHNSIGKVLLDNVYPYEPAVKVKLSTLHREPGLYLVTVRRNNRVERTKLVVQ